MMMKQEPKNPPEFRLPEPSIRIPHVYTNFPNGRSLFNIGVRTTPRNPIAKTLELLEARDNFLIQYVREEKCRASIKAPKPVRQSKLKLTKAQRSRSDLARADKISLKRGRSFESDLNADLESIKDGIAKL